MRAIHPTAAENPSARKNHRSDSNLHENATLSVAALGLGHNFMLQPLRSMLLTALVLLVPPNTDVLTALGSRKHQVSQTGKKRREGLRRRYSERNRGEAENNDNQNENMEKEEKVIVKERRRTRKAV